MDEQEALHQRIIGLEIEHRDLDDVLLRVAQGGAFNQLQAQRLKKRKLILKDEIALLRSRLVPDIIA